MVIALCAFLAAAVNWALVASRARDAAEKSRIAAEQALTKEALARQAEEKSRIRAEKEQHSSEQLVEKMQTDIRFSLLTLGRLDLMSNIHNAIQAYLAESTTPSEGKLSLKAVQEYEEGETFLELKNLAAAKAHFEKSMDYARQAGWSQKEGWHLRRYGWLLYRLSASEGDSTRPAVTSPAASAQPVAAVTPPPSAPTLSPHWAEALQVAERIVKEDPTSPVAQQLWSSVRLRQAALLPLDQRLGAIEKIAGGLKTALDATPKEQMMARADLVMSLATAQSKVITTLRELGRVGDAATLADNSATAVEALNMESSIWELELARALALAGDMHLCGNGFASARTRYNNSIVRLDNLLAMEPRNTAALNLLGYCLTQLIYNEERAGIPVSQVEPLKHRLQEVRIKTQSLFPANDILPSE